MIQHFIFILTSFLLFFQDSIGQESINNTNPITSRKLTRSDSLQIIFVLKKGDSCMKAGSENCNQFFIEALANTRKNGSPYLLSSCYGLAAGLERRGLNTKTDYFDSTSLYYARRSNNDSLLVNRLVYMALGRLSKSNYAMASSCIEEAIDISEQRKDSRLLCMAYLGMAYYLARQFSYTEAKNTCAIALKHAERVALPYWIAVIKKLYYYCNIQQSSSDLNNQYIFEALDYFRKSDRYGEAECLLHLARAYRKVGNKEKALEYFMEAAGIYKSIKAPLNEGETCLFIGEQYLLKNDFTKALEFTAKSELLFPLVSPLLLKTYLNYARIYGAMHNNERSDYYFRKADSINSQDPSNQSNYTIVGYKIEVKGKEGKLHTSGKLIDSAAQLLKKLLPRDVIDNLISRAKSNNLLSTEEAIETHRYFETDRADSNGLQKRKEPIDFSAYTAASTKMNTTYDSLYNRQIVEMEIKYKTRLKNDSIVLVLFQNKIKSDSLQAISRQHLLTRNLLEQKNKTILLFSILLLLSIFFLSYLFKTNNRIALLKKELQHRMENTLQIILTIINRVKSSSNYSHSFELLEQKIEPMFIVYQQLGKEKTGLVSMQNYFETICKNLKKAYNFNKQISIDVEADVKLDGKRASIIGLILNELVTNSLKYAFTDTIEGRIVTLFKKLGRKKYHLSVYDNGKGYTSTSKETGKGLLQVKALAHQLNATIEEHKEKGVRFDVYFT